MPALLEVIVPIHDSGDRGANLSSILSKTNRPDTSFIIISDSKSDFEHTQVRQLIKNSLNPSSKFLFGDFGDPGSARNAGVSVSEAEWVCFLDSDDEISLEEVHILISKAHSQDADVAIGGLNLILESQKIEKKFYLSFDISLYNNLSLTPAFTRMAFRRRFIEGARFFKTKMAEDQCFVFDVFSLNPKVFCSENYFYSYNIGASEQATKNLQSLNDLSKSIKYIFAQLKVSSLEMQQMGITMISRQSITFFSNLGIRINQSSLSVIATLLKIYFCYPSSSIRSLFLIIRNMRRKYV